ncbi:alanine--tRNA ligase [Leptospira broomii serovar Hurstbridge str. 5399]|uniref:Alanine--tRNA ligase n=1 Tax=Leptospira broomii serovar Hurstbridge str. 5399 TaxID=1049789 RepID=T0EZ42_9LEPT|nr:alanine--tRNA ligase [Leptospira broomii]EQA44125.1 alanine--tRNA ligase [Leptospira broomii serovar Hurstbridge str. 5399]
MKYKKVSEVRNTFLNYFKQKGHTVVPSSSLLPAGDPTLLFTTAGMVQFKPFFTGAVDLPYTRATSAQKCLRTTDLENVGKTERHCTFFEMLGNFSFGDYFKEEAIEFALDCSVNYLGFPKDKIWITVFENDDEAEKIWISKGIPVERITRLGKKDNFWGPAGDSGACGPCSELYLDRGPEKGFPDCGTKKECRPGCDCDRFLEFWNIVFNQFNQDTDGNLHPLKQTGIDTGSGLERVALLLQGVDSVYDTDELRGIISEVEKVSGKSYGESTKVPFRVITDHIRSALFAVSDGIYPDRTGRGYVIRRLIRRAVLFARKLDLKEPFLHKLVKPVVTIYKERYPELEKHASSVERTLLAEEELFLKTLEIGLEKIGVLVAKTKASESTVFSGKDSFLLYGTYGFPAEMTEEIVAEHGLSFDRSGFEEELEKDRQSSRETWKANRTSLFTGIKTDKTEFLGYTRLEARSEIEHAFLDNKPAISLTEGQSGVLTFKATPFYPEGGGQVGDTGFIRKDASIFKVLDTQKENDIILHYGIVLNGSFNVGDEAVLEVERERREKLKSHHSGTHLLNGALRSLLGAHVMQKGSIVSPEYLRFDFSHPTPLSEEEIRKVESWVNDSIGMSIPVETKVLPIEEAKKTGAVAAFDEKYGDSVRVLQMGDRSLEFCGGTHVLNTGDIRYFFIKKESSPGAGNRRIEAVAGPVVIETFQTRFAELTSAVQTLNLKIKEELNEESASLSIKASVPGPEEIRAIFEKKGAGAVSELRNLSEKLSLEIEETQSKFLKEKKNRESRDFENNPQILSSILSAANIVGSVKIVHAIFDSKDAKALKGLSDNLKVREKDIVAILASRNDEDASIVVTCSSSLAGKLVHCGDLVKAACEVLGGKGGGKPDMAQGGGKNVSKVEEAVELAVNRALAGLNGSKV